MLALIGSPVNRDIQPRAAPFSNFSFNCGLMNG